MIRASLRIVLTAVILLFCLLGYALARPLAREGSWVRRFLRLVGRAFGARVRIVGVPLDRDVLFVANHLSWIDILVLGGATGAAFVSKDVVARWPVVGRLARMAGTIFIDRTSRAGARGQADALAAALRTGRPAAFFPEGTTGGGVTLLPFRAALFEAVRLPPAGVQVQPVAIDYGAATAGIVWPEDESAVRNALRLIGRRGTLLVTLRFLRPIEAIDLPDRKAIAAAAQAAIAAALPPAPGVR